MTAPEPKRGLVFRCHFHNERELRAALEEYSLLQGAVGVQRYGDPEGDARARATDEEIPLDAPPGKLERIMAQNTEIDRRMELLRAKAPYWHRILDLYYREGLCGENKGWCLVAKRAGLAADPKSRWDHDTFDRQVEIAVGRLFYVK
jgi:hypothetical protein